MKTDKINKIRKVALDYNAPEKGNASRILAKQGVYIDIAGIEWTKDRLERFSQEKRKFLFVFEPVDNPSQD